MSYEQRIKNIMDKFGCSREDAIQVINYRDEGYSICQATLYTGVTDISYWNKESEEN